MGMIFDIQRGCIDDGPGIRTTVFMKGCPLDCLWCHNPESKSMQPERWKDTGKIVGRDVSAGEVLREVARDRAYYQSTGGGMTLSGGEPLFQPAFAVELLSGAKDIGIHTCVETSGFASWSVLERFVPLTDLFLYDIKATPGDHKRLTGVDGTVILDNLQKLLGTEARVLLRCPIIPGCNDTPEHFAWLKALIEDCTGALGLEMMPYHNLGVGKARRLGKAAAVALDNPSRETIAAWRAALGCGEDNTRWSKERPLC